MPQLQVEAALNSKDSTVIELLNAYEEICVQYGYLTATSTYGIRQNAQVDLLETFCLMTLLKLRINSLTHINNT